LSLTKRSGVSSETDAGRIGVKHGNDSQRTLTCSRPPFRL
jgi:hypothetical protein